MIMDRLYGGVCYAGIDTDPELKYPKVNMCCHIPQLFANKISFRVLVAWLSPTNKATSQLSRLASFSFSMATSISALRSSRTFWMIRCATSAVDSVAAASLPRSSAPTSHVSRYVESFLLLQLAPNFIVPSSTIASIAGLQFIPVPAANTTSRWSRKEPIVHAPFLSVGVKQFHKSPMMLVWVHLMARKF